MNKRKHFLGNRQHTYDPVWHVEGALAFVIVLQLLLPDRFVAGPRYVLPALELVLMAFLVFTTPKLPLFSSPTRRINVFGLLAAIGGANTYALVKLATDLLAGGRITGGQELILAAMNIYLTNVIVFGLIYWEMDAGGPGKRRGVDQMERDFLFPQMTMSKLKDQWHPTFIDYLYIAGTNASAFSPTDTLPLTRRAKMLMYVQALIALITLALVAARAVNILR